MNNNQKRILVLILIFIGLLVINIISLNASYSNLSNQNITHETNITSATSTTLASEEVITTNNNSITTTKKSTTIDKNTTKNDKNNTTQPKTNVSSTTTKKSTTTTAKTTTTISTPTEQTTVLITTESNEIEEDDTGETLDKMYYYSWTNESERDYTGRNCLFIYDEEGKATEGYANVIYYGKYKKKQYISSNVDNCFLEDMYSVEVESIIVDGVKYE